MGFLDYRITYKLAPTPEGEEHPNIMVTDLRKAAEMALWALDGDHPDIQLRAAITLRAALAQPEQTAMPPDIAKVLFDNVESLYVEDAQPEPELAIGQIEGHNRAMGVLAQPEQEPVAWMYEYASPRRGRGLGFYETPDFEATCAPLYTAPPQRKPLTDEEIHRTTVLMGFNPEWKTEIGMVHAIVRAIERAHGIV